MSILLICGVRQVGNFILPSNTDTLVLPSVCKDEDGMYASRCLNLDLEWLVDLRRSVLFEALEIFNPDLLLVDKVAWGFERELEPALAMLKARSNTKCVLGLRDVMDDPKAAREEWNSKENDQAIRSYYDQVWIYGDANIYKLDAECDFEAASRQKTVYTGYINPHDIPIRIKDESHLQSSPYWLHTKPYVLCLVGGGQDGFCLARQFAQAEYGAERVGVIVTGPYMPIQDKHALFELARERSDLYVYEFVADVLPLVMKADKIVSLGGYNSVCEILACGKPLMIVPRTKPRQEQLVRARALNTLDYVDYFEIEKLTPQVLSRWMVESSRLSAPITSSINFNGAAKIKDLVMEIMSSVVKNSKPVSHE